MYMVLFVLNDPSRLDEVLNAWDSIGVTGVTFIESSGIARRKIARQVGSTFMSGINRLMSGDQESHYTLFSIVKNEETVNQCLAAAEEIVGDLETPDSGILAAWPLAISKGIPDK